MNHFIVRALASAVALFWGGAVFFVGLANMIRSGYGVGFLKLCASVYPGYEASGTFGSLIVGVLYALLAGAVGGLLFGWVYNLISRRCKCSAS